MGEGERQPASGAAEQNRPVVSRSGNTVRIAVARFVSGGRADPNQAVTEQNGEPTVQVELWLSAAENIYSESLSLIRLYLEL
jgi:hypothetical protein